eukprot:comp18561_c0_seq1/m.20046 comp18561_c0_seq1/g.20046  ORF comp18561_c0_seq1/g.20046 comp18561_c0_seq1/m.20046 type:complete len:369 (-) comp18561_c0_seq1:491-1597(-)
MNRKFSHLLAVGSLLALTATVESVPAADRLTGDGLLEDEFELFDMIPENTPVPTDVMPGDEDSECNAINFSTAEPLWYPAPCNQEPARPSNFPEFASWQNYSLEGFKSTFSSQIEQQCLFESCWNTHPSNSWGPTPPCFTVDLPSTEISVLRQRVMLATLYYVNASIHGNLVYAHHHSPYWTPPAGETPVGDDSDDAIFAGETANNSLNSYDTSEVMACNSKRTGIDCTSFTTWVYNFALGILFSGDTTQQSGMGLPKITDMNQLQNGDLIYFKGAPDGTKITHGGIAMNTPNGTIAITSTIQGDADGPQFNYKKNWWPLDSFAHGFSLADVYKAWTGGKSGIAPNYCIKVPKAMGECSALTRVKSVP